MSRAQKKAERQQILRRVYEEKRNEQIMKNMVCCFVPCASNNALQYFTEIFEPYEMNLCFRLSGIKCLC